MKILVAGELNPDLIMQGYDQFPTLGKEVLVQDLVLTLGSASAICAAGLAKLGNDVSFIGKLGRDVYGDFCIEQLRRLGVDTSLVIRDARVKTGITVSISSAKDRALVTYLGAISELRASDIDRNALAGFNHFHVSSFFLQHSLRPDLNGLFADAHERGLTTSLDPGFDPTEKWDGGIRQVLQQTDVFLPNEVEMEALGGAADPGEALKRLDNGRTLTVAKLGARGAAALDIGDLVQAPSCRVDPVDTTGAGDSFNAGFLHAWLRQQPIRHALEFACACGALSTLGLGGTGKQATEQEALRFLSSGSGAGW